MPQKDSGVEIIGYAEPWIVSPGDQVEIKVCNFFADVVRYHTADGQDLIHRGKIFAPLIASNPRP